MTPLICFYQNEKYIFSTQYRRLVCPPDQKTLDFLTAVGVQNADQMKIVQLNFECLDVSSRKTLYESPSAQIFVLDKYELVSEAEMFQRLPDEKIEIDSWKLFESAESFKQKVNLSREAIAKGRLYQVNLTTGLRSTTANSAAAIFKSFFQRFKGHYKAFLPLAQVEAICFSPEMFLEKRNGTLRTCPIKGSIANDRSFEVDLLQNKKEEAELSMIVDLLRNDLNRVEENQSATVTQHRAHMSLGYIQHTYSEIEIKTDRALPEILENTYPGGSISGCPKTESLKLISELEPVARQIYTGSIGWWYRGDFTLNLAIRTFIKTPSELFYQAGCGIVYDSNADDEWNEFLIKTGSLQETAPQ